MTELITDLMNQASFLLGLSTSLLFVAVLAVFWVVRK